MASSLKWSLHVPVKADVPIVPDEKEFVALQTNRVQIARLSGSTYERRPMPISLSRCFLSDVTAVPGKSVHRWAFSGRG